MEIAARIINQTGRFFGALPETLRRSIQREPRVASKKDDYKLYNRADLEPSNNAAIGTEFIVHYLVTGKNKQGEELMPHEGVFAFTPSVVPNMPDVGHDVLGVVQRLTAKVDEGYTGIRFRITENATPQVVGDVRFAFLPEFIEGLKGAMRGTIELGIVGDVADGGDPWGAWRPFRKQLLEGRSELRDSPWADA
jgi:hypothetical protein